MRAKTIFTFSFQVTLLTFDLYTSNLFPSYCCPALMFSLN